MRPYPKAIINPITAPRMVLMYGLQVKPQVLPIFMETRLRANPMTAPMTGPRMTFSAMADSFVSVRGPVSSAEPWCS